MRGSPTNRPLVIKTLNELDGDRMATAVKLGLSLCAVRNAVEWALKHGHKVKPSKGYGHRQDVVAYEPSEAEIAEKTAAFRKSWSCYERWRRSGGFDGSNADYPLETQEVSRIEIGAAATYLWNSS